MGSPQSRKARIAIRLEAYLKFAFAVGLRACLVVSGLFLAYVIIGSSVIFLGWPNLSHPIFSLESDPVFVGGGALVGVFMLQSSGSFVLYQMLVGVEGGKSQLTILFGFISLGFSGALLRVTLPPAIQLLLALV
jgi:hypothetical protein